MHIGTVNIPGKLYLAPMAGVTDLAFRQICRELGADMSCTELVSGRLRAVLDDEANPLWHLVRREAAAELLTGEYPWPWYGQLMRAPQTMAYLLQIEFWLRFYKIRLCF